ncbi:copper chaperone PCu(A)C [Roseicella frigidaeris]|uniref:copper chaperone PCu(A)C n=1 Tax=Roseicella frigidaeris TaxID=2230885 RepID=UPI001FB5318B|nr:copper chaperone PCu(A)C [Roseicella frigidaeris]
MSGAGLRRRRLLAAALLPALPLAARAQQAGDLRIAEPWTRAAGQSGTGAGFLTIANQGGAADRLIGASTPAARVTEIHTHVREGDVLRMRPVAAVEIPAGQTVTLQPGGFHLMLIGLLAPLIQGQTVPVTLRFERAGEVQVTLAVLPAGAGGPKAPAH